EQVNDQGEEADVDLLPGYGLALKNQFMYFVTDRRGYFVYQRDVTASHYTRFQRYLREVSTPDLRLEPMLTGDAYERLMRDEADLRAVDFSITRPKEPGLYPDEWSLRFMDMMNKAGGE